MWTSNKPRLGSILPLVVIGLVGLLGFVALAIDIGLIVAAKNQAQNAADLAAMTGARVIDGSPSSNLTNATAKAVEAAKKNTILSKAVTDSEVAITHGYYYYDQASQKFEPRLSTPAAPDNYNLTQAVVTRNDSTAFARVFNITSFNVQAAAIATHRPRDVAIVLDFSGSMNNESDLWNNEGYLGTENNSPNNTDAIFPTFGHYSSTNARMQCVSGDPRVGKCNVTHAVLGISSLVEDFFQNIRGASPSQAFGTASNTFATTPNGDVPLKDVENTGSTWAQTVSNFVSDTTWDLRFERDGYSRYTPYGVAGRTNYTDPSDNTTRTWGWHGFTQGPKYYGKTFMIWPPDPRLKGAVPNATVPGWLQEFGYPASALTGTSTNERRVQGLFTANGEVSNGVTARAWADWPAGGALLRQYLLGVPHPSQATPLGTLKLNSSDTVYNWINRLHDRINFPEHCDWRARFFLQNDGVTPITDNSFLFDTAGVWRTPSAGNFKINYAAILKWIKETPCPFPTTLRAGRILYYDAIPDDVPASAYTWTNANSDITDANQRFWKEYIDYMLGQWRDPFGNRQAPGNPACSIGPDFNWGTTQTSAKPTAAPAGNFLPQYMSYTDNPQRPRHRGWFGPMTMVQFISDTSLNPGTVHDISMLPAKLGIQGAITTIQNNHPNDLVSLIMFNRPRISSDPPNVGAFSKAQISLSRDYQGMINALYYPPNSSTADVRPWDSNGVQTPRAFGDFTSNTCTNYGLMVAYNQMSSSSTLRASALGGDGRKGAQRLVILETDGMANLTANASFSNNGANNSYYNIAPSDTITSGGSASTSAIDACQRICALPTGSTYSPGYATTKKPVIVHCVAFGAVFEPTAAGTDPDNAMSLLQQISTIGGTGFPPSRTATSDPNYYKLCIGTLTERQDKLRTAFSKIMDDGVGVTVIR